MGESPVLTEGDLVADRYRILRAIGSGGMGVVYAAEHVWTKRSVALKVLRAERAQNAQLAARFLREARVLSQLQHPHIVQVLDMGQDDSDGALFLAQELLDGEDLAAVLRAQRVLSPAQAAAVLLPIVDALACAHRAGVLHRDVKPANIFLHRGANGSVVPRLIDFGVARSLVREPSGTLQTQFGTPVGTPMYMSPEQVRGDVDLDVRSDVWSVGAVLYECITGCTPFDGTTATLLFAQILTQDVRPARAARSDVSEPVEALLQHALQRDRVARIANMESLREAMGTALGAPSTDVLRTLQSGASTALSTTVADDSTQAASTRSETNDHASKNTLRSIDDAVPAIAAPARAVTTNDAPVPGVVVAGTHERRASARSRRSTLLVLVPAVLAAMLGGGWLVRTRWAASSITRGTVPAAAAAPTTPTAAIRTATTPAATIASTSGPTSAPAPAPTTPTTPTPTTPTTPTTPAPPPSPSTETVALPTTRAPSVSPSAVRPVSRVRSPSRTNGVRMAPGVPTTVLSPVAPVPATSLEPVMP